MSSNSALLISPRAGQGRRFPSTCRSWRTSSRIRASGCRSRTCSKGAPAYFNDFYAREFWRFVYVQQKVGELAKTAIEYPPMQKGASFNFQAVREGVEA